MRRISLIALTLFVFSCAEGDDGLIPPDGAAAVPDAEPEIVPDARPAVSADAAVRIDAMGPADAEPPPADAMQLVYEGFVFLLEVTKVGKDDRASTGGRMIPGSFWGPDGGSFGDCIVYTNVPLKGGSAGNITIKGATNGHLSMPPNGTATPLINYKKAAGISANAFDPGDEITFEAAGGPDVDAFTDMVIAPSKMSNVTMPSEVSLSTPYTVTWDAGDGDFALLWLSTWPTPGLLSCEIPDTGSYTIPLEALALIPAGNDVAVSHLYRVNQTIASAGVSSVTLWVADLFDNGELDIVP